MSKRITIALLAMLGLTFSPAFSKEQLLQPGQFHGDEVTAASGERWFALYVRSGKATLVEKTLKVELVNDPVMDDKKGKTGKMVSVGEPEPLFLIKDISGVKSGAVESAEISAELNNEDNLKLVLNKKHYTLSLGLQKNKEKSITAYKLTLSDGKHSQILAEMPQCEFISGSGGPYIIWAGDIDRDGKLDLVLDTTSNYNLFRPTLFLSSGAGNGKLVRQAAEFSSTGC